MKHDSPVSLEAHVNELLQTIAPTLGLHGGSLELVSISEEGVVAIRFAGACIGCAAATYTLDFGIKRYLMLQDARIHDVIAVNDEPITHAAPTIPLPFHA